MLAAFPEQMAIRLAPFLALRVYEMPVELAPIPLGLICIAGMTMTLGVGGFGSKSSNLPRASVATNRRARSVSSMTAATAVPDGSEAASRLNTIFLRDRSFAELYDGTGSDTGLQPARQVASIRSRCDGSGGDCSVTAPFRPSVSTLAVPAAMSCQNRFDDEDIASMVELP